MFVIGHVSHLGHRESWHPSVLALVPGLIAGSGLDAPEVLPGRVVIPHVGTEQAGALGTAIPAEFMESGLFGHEKGSYTRAVAHKLGHLELAYEGSLFLGEVGDPPLEMQPNLPKALQ